MTPTATSTRARCEEDEEDDEGECTRTPTVTATATFTPTATATSTVTPTATPTRVSQPTLVLVPTSGPAATSTTGTWTASGFPSGDAIGLTVTNLSCNNPPELSYSVVVPNTTGTTSGTFSISGGEPNCQVSIAALDQATHQSASVTFTFT